LRNEGLLTVGAGDNVVRLLPPLIIGEEEVRYATEAIERAASAFAAAKSSNAA